MINLNQNNVRRLKDFVFVLLVMYMLYTVTPNSSTSTTPATSAPQPQPPVPATRVPAAAKRSPHVLRTPPPTQSAVTGTGKALSKEQVAGMGLVNHYADEARDVYGFQVPKPHDIPFVKTVAYPPKLSTFYTESQVQEVTAELLQYGQNRFEKSLEVLARGGVAVDDSAVEAVKIAFKAYKKTVLGVCTTPKTYASHSNQLINARYWSTLYPTLGCHNTLRVGLAPDGGRFLCNGRSLGYDGRVDVVGFGSNNQWEWEDALLTEGEMTVHNITTLDCTVATPTPPASCGDRCRFRRLCVGDHDNEQLMRIGSIPSRLGVSKVALLKLDVEGWEFRAVPDWVQQWARGKTDLEVQQVQIEFHRIGWKRPAGTHWNSLLVSHLLFLHFYAMGFVPVQYERNHMDDCCFEYTFVNATWYVQSELKERQRKGK